MTLHPPTTSRTKDGWPQCIISAQPAAAAASVRTITLTCHSALAVISSPVHTCLVYSSTIFASCVQSDFVSWTVVLPGPACAPHVHPAPRVFLVRNCFCACGFWFCFLLYFAGFLPAFVFYIQYFVILGGFVLLFVSAFITAHLLLNHISVFESALWASTLSGILLLVCRVHVTTCKGAFGCDCFKMMQTTRVTFSLQ